MSQRTSAVSPRSTDLGFGILITANDTADLWLRQFKFESAISLLLLPLGLPFTNYFTLLLRAECGLEQSIKHLGAMARTAGIHLIIATQRPEAKVVTPIIRSNLPGRVALRTASEADSAIILGNKQTNYGGESAR